jgi:predicted ATPase
VTITPANDEFAPPSRRLARRLAPFFGRRADLERLLTLISDGARLVTLTGAAGFGKTRLAHECGLRLQEDRRWTGGVWFCDLRPCQTLQGLCGAVAAALGIPAGSSGTRGDAVGHLRGYLSAIGPTVLIADNLEHILTPARQALADWLRAVPDLVVLATSREAVRLDGEVCHAVGPFALAERGASANDAPAVQLFFQRATAAAPGFVRTADNVAAVARLVAQLDGNPLAIELAASRVPTLTPSQLLARLHKRFELLTSTDAGDKRGLWAVINESWEALSQAEQRGLMHLAVFDGGASLEAAEAVIGEDQAATDKKAPIDVLSGLVRKSLVMTTVAPSMPEVRRFDLYVSVRAFALARLAATPGLETIVRQRQAGWLAVCAARLRDLPETADPAVARALIAAELDNFFSMIAAGTAASAPQATVAAAVETLLAIREVLICETPLTTVRDCFLNAMARVDCLPIGLRARLMARHGAILARLGDERPARTALMAAYRLAVQSGDARIEGHVLCLMGRLITFEDASAYVAPFQRAIKLLEQAGARDLWIQAHNSLALAYVHLGDFKRAAEVLKPAINAIATLRYPETFVVVTNTDGMINVALGRWRAAITLFERAVDAARRTRNPLLECVAGGNLGECALKDGRLDAAIPILERSLQLARQLGYPRQIGVSTAFLAAIAHLRGHPQQAHDGYAAALDSLRIAGKDLVAEGQLRAGQALAAAQLGHQAEAERGFALAEACLNDVGDPLLLMALKVHRSHAAVIAGEVSGAHAEHEAVLLVARAEELAREQPPPVRVHQVRHSLQLLQIELRGPDIEQASAAAPPEPATAEIVYVGPTTRFIQLADGAKVDLSRRARARKLIDCLVAHHADAPGRSVDVHTLFETGWPGDNVDEPYRSNRVYVTLKRLRDAGLAGLLLHDGDGYLLDPRIVVERSS